MNRLNLIRVFFISLFILTFNHVAESEYNHFNLSEGEAIALNLGIHLEYYREMRDAFIQHETGGTFDPKQKQIGGGPGRGLFQMDPHTLVTNTKRLLTYYLSNNQVIPNYLRSILFRKIEDASLLTANQQEVLFVGGLMQIIKEGENYITVRNSILNDQDISTIPEVWIKLHNRSTGADSLIRYNHFVSQI